MREKNPQRTIPAGDGKSTYVLHKIKAKYYWYKHSHDPETGKTKAVREDPPGLDLSGLPYEPTSQEVIKEYLVTQDLEAPEPTPQVILPSEISQEIDLVVEKLEERVPVLTRSKRNKEVRILNETIELFKKIKQAL